MGEIGGAFALLTFVHFAVDWIFQSHSEAMRKHDHRAVRAKHCAIYTVPFAAILAWSALEGTVSASTAFLLALMLFLSHFVEDTYLPVLLWAKYVRRPPSMRWRIVVDEFDRTVLRGPEVKVDGKMSDLPSDKDLSWRETLVGQVVAGSVKLGEARRDLDRRGFVEFVSDPLGKILMIAVDQIVHIVFLLPVAYCMTR